MNIWEHPDFYLLLSNFCSGHHVKVPSFSLPTQRMKMMYLTSLSCCFTLSTLTQSCASAALSQGSGWTLWPRTSSQRGLQCHLEPGGVAGDYQLFDSALPAVGREQQLWQGGESTLRDSQHRNCGGEKLLYFQVRFPVFPPGCVQVLIRLSELSSSHSEAVLNVLRSRREEICHALLTRTHAISSAMLQDFDWQLKVNKRIASFNMSLCPVNSTQSFFIFIFCVNKKYSHIPSVALCGLTLCYFFFFTYLWK